MPYKIHGLLFSVEKNYLFQMKVSKPREKKTQLVYSTSQRQKVPVIAHKQNISRIWSIQETQDTPQMHSQGVEQITVQKVVLF